MVACLDRESTVFVRVVGNYNTHGAILLLVDAARRVIDPGRFERLEHPGKFSKEGHDRRMSLRCSRKLDLAEPSTQRLRQLHHRSECRKTKVESSDADRQFCSVPDEP